MSKPVSTPSPESVPPEKKPAEQPKALLSFIVGTDAHSNVYQVPSYFFDTVVRACADRLDDSESIKVDTAGRDMSRGEAIKRAKAEKEAYLVWLELRFEGMRSARNNDLSEIYLEYSVYAPTTAKIVTSGHTYQHGYRTGPVIVGPGTSGRSNIPYTEHLLKQAAREAAERILAAMRDRTPADRVPG